MLASWNDLGSVVFSSEFWKSFEKDWFSSCFYFSFLIGRKLPYNVVLVSAIRQYESSVSIIYIYPLPLEPSHQPSASHLSETELNSLCYTAASTSVLFHTRQYYVSATLSIHPTFPFPPLCPQVHSLCLHLSSCPAKRFISTIFLDPCIWVNIPYLFSPFWLTSFCMTDSRFINIWCIFKYSFSKEEKWQRQYETADKLNVFSIQL